MTATRHIFNEIFTMLIWDFMGNLSAHPIIKMIQRLLKWRAAMIKTVIRTSNNMVMVFNDEGEQMPEYQGRYEDVRDKILKDAPAGNVFNHWFSHSLEPAKVLAEKW